MKRYLWMSSDTKNPVARWFNHWTDDEFIGPECSWSYNFSFSEIIISSYLQLFGPHLKLSAIVWSSFETLSLVSSKTFLWNIRGKKSCRVEVKLVHYNQIKFCLFFQVFQLRFAHKQGWWISTSLLVSCIPALAHRCQFHTFARKYSFVSPKKVRGHEQAGGEDCKAIFESLMRKLDRSKGDVISGSWALGKRHVFYR